MTTRSARLSVVLPCCPSFRRRCVLFESAASCSACCFPSSFGLIFEATDCVCHVALSVCSSTVQPCALQRRFLTGTSRPGDPVWRPGVETRCDAGARHANGRCRKFVKPAFALAAAPTVASSRPLVGRQGTTGVVHARIVDLTALLICRSLSVATSAADSPAVRELGHTGLSQHAGRCGVVFVHARGCWCLSSGQLVAATWAYCRCL